jgi:hypothetical protein
MKALFVSPWDGNAARMISQAVVRARKQWFAVDKVVPIKALKFSPLGCAVRI